MHNYSYNVFWSDEDEGYIALVADVEELSGVSAFGDTAEEALHELGIALKGVEASYQREGRPMPEPQVLAVG